ncbi:TetR family transcriptional regulator [Pseudomonas aeruginosa]
MTLDAVVVRAGLSKGAFLYHFKTKRDLFVTLIDEMIRAFDAVQANHERRFAGDPDPWLSSQVEAMADDEMQKMGAALLAAAAEDPTLLDPLREWYRVQYERVRRSPRGTETAALIMLALDGALFADLLGLPILAPAERRHFFRALQDLASGHLELVPAKGRT